MDSTPDVPLFESARCLDVLHPGAFRARWNWEAVNYLHISPFFFFFFWENNPSVKNKSLLLEYKMHLCKKIFNISKYLFPRGYIPVIIVIQTSSGAKKWHMHMYVKASLVRTPTRPSTDTHWRISLERSSRVHPNTHRVWSSRGTVYLARRSRKLRLPPAESQPCYPVAEKVRSTAQQQQQACNI